MDEIESRLRSWKREYFLAALAEGLSRSAVSAGALVLAALLVDAAAGLSLGFRWPIFALILIVTSLSIYIFLLVPLIQADSASILRDASRKYSDLAPYLLSAWELSKNGAGPASEALAQCHIEQARAALASKPVLPMYDVRLSQVCKRGLAGLAILSAISLPWLSRHSPGWERILSPWREISLEQSWEITPGDKRAAWGSVVAITARRRQSASLESGKILGHGEEVVLWLRSSGEPWSKMEWDSVIQGAWNYQINELNRPIDYQLRWKGERSRTYTLQPIPFPRIIDLKARIHLPGHLSAQDAQADVNLEGRGEIAALAGSWIEIYGRPSAALGRAEVRVSYLNEPVEMRRNADGRYEAGFPLTQDGNFRLELASQEGLSDPHPITYQLKSVVDQPPTAEILSPAFEAEASPRDKLPITYEIRDDYGLTAADIVYRIAGAESSVTVVPVKKFPGGAAHPVTEYIGDYSWELSGLPLGQRIEFQIRATDNNIVRPQFGFSPKSYLRLVDFEGEHVRVEQDWLKTAKKMEELAAKEKSARDLLKSLSRPMTEQEKQKLQEEWKQMDASLAQAWKEDSQLFQDYADLMSRDPYANPALAEQAMRTAENLKRARDGALPAASKNAAEKKWTQAEAMHEFLEAQARKAAEMMSRGHELQAMQDFWNDAQRMDRAGKDLASSLSELAKNPKSMSESDRRRLGQALENLQKEMQVMSEVLQSMPKPKSDAAGQRRKVFSLPMNSARQAADELQKALAAGDYAKAAEIAQRMSEDLAKARQAIADAARSAAEDAGFSQSGQDALSKKMEKTMGQWQKAVDEQNRSLSLAQKLEEERTKELLELQRHLLEDLAVRQKKVVDEASQLENLIAPDIHANMKAVLDEFAAKEVSKAPQLLQQAIQRLQSGAAARSDRRDPMERLAQKEQGILDDLNKGVKLPSSGQSQSEGAAAAGAAQGQAQGEAAELGKQLDSLQQEADGMPSSAGESVGKAIGEQGQAKSSLNRLDVPGAIGHEEKALGLLQQGMKEMSSAMQSQQGMEAAAMRPFSSTGGAVRPAGSRSTAGADTSFVPLPSASDYKPPQEIRDDVEKSLQERRPHAYDGVIKDYFKRISQ